MTPINEAIQYFSNTNNDHYNAESIVKYLEGMREKEKEFVGDVFEQGSQWQYERDNLTKVKAPDQQQYLKSLYGE